jgi:cysteine desulfurase
LRTAGRTFTLSPAKLNVIYLDHNATTPIAPEVLEAMMPHLPSEWGNPSSTYAFGSKLKTAVETARTERRK